MAKESKQTLFRRLTRLFKSGAPVKRKLRTLDTTIAVADKSKSSGAMLFQKSLAPTYATITANAYNLSERLMRYQDFQEMEYSIISTTCIPTVDGLVEIGELARRCQENPDYRFIVYSYDHERKQIVPALGKQARQTCVDHAWKVTFDNGKEITASPEHRLMLRDGTYRKVEDLQPGDAMMPFYRKDLFENAEEGTKGYSWVYTMDERFRGWTKEHQLVAEWVAGRKLAEDECVHHINFVKNDNRPENLKIMTNSDHNSYHADLNNKVKWAPENHEWIEKFKSQHSAWMRDNAPTARKDVTFARILETAERVGFSMPAITSALDVTWNLVLARLVANGFANFTQFVRAYADGQHSAVLPNNRPGLLTRDLSIELIKCHITETDTKRSLCIKLGCTVNVLDKFFNRRALITWKQLRSDLGYGNESVVSMKPQNVRGGGRPAGTSKISYKQVCDAFQPGMNRVKLADKLNVSTSVVMSRLNSAGFKKFSEWSSSYANCKVVSVEYVGVLPLYDLTVDGYKNFATDSVVSHNTPEIAAAMDIYADETVASDEKGRCLHIYSDNEKIKQVLEDLFYNTLNVEFNLRSWTRNLVKYGDFFLLNDVSPEHGVVNAFPIPVNEIEREENYDRDDPFAVRFRWVTLGNRVLENWEVSHFRLLGNDMFLPYGSSVIEPARRIWRQLILIEDAMLVYRVVRAPERRVFYIDVANVPPENVAMYVEEQKQNLRTNQVVDRSTGRVDLRYNPLCFQQLTRIPLLDGRTITIKELAEEWESGKRDHETYSLDLENGGRIVPGRVIWAGKSGVSTQLARVTLDDGGVIEVTPDHKLMLRDGNPVKAKDLLTGDSLMPLHVRFKTMLDETVTFDDKNAYEQVLDPASGTYYYTHRLVAAANNGLRVYGNGFIAQQGTVIHHRDHNKRNNASSNLELMTREAHSLHHGLLASENITKYNKSEAKRQRTSMLNRFYQKAQHMGDVYNGTPLHASHNVIRKEAQKRSWSTKRDQRSQAMRYVWTPECQAQVIQQIRQLSQFEGLEAFLRRLSGNERFVETYAEANKHLARDSRKSIHKAVVGKFITRDYKDWKSVWAAHHPSALGRRFVNNVDPNTTASEGPNNHKVVSVEIIDVVQDVYNVTVDNWHNLTIQASNCDQPNCGKVQSFQSVDEDYFIPVRGTESGTRIDTLAGGQNAAAVEDVAYIQKKLFAALKIPRAYLGYDELLSCLVSNTCVPLLDGRTLTVEELSMEFHDGKQNWVYSYDKETGKIVPGKITMAGPTRPDAELVRVTLDNGVFVDCTPDHKWMTRTGEWCEAKDLQPNQSLMPLYRKRVSLNGGCDYEKVYDPGTNKWVWTHRAVHERSGGVGVAQSASDVSVIHHVDFDRFNNNPENLQRMGYEEHRAYHAEHLDVIRKKTLASGGYSGLNNDWARKCKEKVKHLWNVDLLIKHCVEHKPKSKHALISGYGLSETQLHRLFAENSITYAEFAKKHMDGYRLARKGVGGYSIPQYRRIGSFAAYCKDNNISQTLDVCCRSCGKSFVTSRRKPAKFCCNDCYTKFGRGSSIKNHTVVSVVPLPHREQTWCISVEKYENFAVANSVIISNSKATLAQEDIRFSRTINVIQKTMLAELNKVAIIHLYANGFDADDLANFTLRLSNPSTVAQQQKLELWRAKFEIAGSAPEGFGSKDFVRKEIWGLNDEQCSSIDEQRMREKIVDSKIEGAAVPGGEGEEPGADLFGGEEEAPEAGGGEGGGGEEEALPPPETAADDHEDEFEPGVELLTSSDDADDDEKFDLRLTSRELEAPVKVQRHLDKVLYNRDRRRTHGASKTHFPDFQKMTSNSSQAMKDPYDSSWSKSVVSNPFGESKTTISYDTKLMLEKMQASPKFQKPLETYREKVLTEGVDVQDEIDGMTDASFEVGLPEAEELDSDVLLEDNDVFNDVDDESLDVGEDE